MSLDRLIALSRVVKDILKNFFYVLIFDNHSMYKNLEMICPFIFSCFISVPMHWSIHVLIV